MLFSSLTFLYFFLPVVLVVYYAIPAKYKNVFLCLASFFFYAWGEPAFCILLLLYGVTGYFAGKYLEQKNRWVLTGCLVVFFGGLFYFKYWDFVWRNLTLLWYGKSQKTNIVLPIGISFFTFQVVSYVIDVYCGRTKAQKKSIDFLTYLSMFPQLIAGPIVRYTEIEKELQYRKISREEIAYGVHRFLIGLGKKVLLADCIGEMILDLQMITDENSLRFWMLSCAYMLQVYYDFSGYSDMAIGLGRMLGFRFPENFNYPLSAGSIAEFWRKWHMTLNRFFRDYLYIPLGGNRVKPMRYIFNVVCVWAASGLWHGADWQFLLWGIYLAVILLGESFVLKKCQTKKIHAKAHAAYFLFRHFYTLFFITISFAIFGNSSMSEIGHFLKGMLFWWNYQETSPAFTFYLQKYGVLFTVSLLGAFPLAQAMIKKCRKNRFIYIAIEMLEPIFNILLLILSTAYLINSSFHPFLYFRF